MSVELGPVSSGNQALSGRKVDLIFDPVTHFAKRADLARTAASIASSLKMKELTSMPGPRNFRILLVFKRVVLNFIDLITTAFSQLFAKKYDVESAVDSPI